MSKWKDNIIAALAVIGIVLFILVLAALCGEMDYWDAMHPM